MESIITDVRALHFCTLWLLDISNLNSQIKHWLEYFRSLEKSHILLILKNWRADNGCHLVLVFYTGPREIVPSIFLLFPLTLKELKNNGSLEKTEYLNMKWIPNIISNYKLYDIKFLSEISQPKKDDCHMISLICGI